MSSKYQYQDRPIRQRLWCKSPVCNVQTLRALTAQSVCCEWYSHTGRTGLSGLRWQSVCHLDSRPRWSSYPHETDSSLFATPLSTQQSHGERNVTEDQTLHTTTHLNILSFLSPLESVNIHRVQTTVNSATCTKIDRMRSHEHEEAALDTVCAKCVKVTRCDSWLSWRRWLAVSNYDHKIYLR